MSPFGTLLRLRQCRDHVIQHPRTAAHLVHADAFVIAMLRAALFLGGCERRKSVCIDP